MQRYLFVMKKVQKVQHGAFKVPDFSKRSQGNYWKILRKQLRIRGTWNSSYLGDYPEAEKDDWHYVLGRLASESIHPEKLITHELKLSELEKGLLVMRDKKEDYIKIVVEEENYLKRLGWEKSI